MTFFCSPCLSFVYVPSVTGSSAFKQRRSQSSGTETRFCCCRFRSGSAASSSSALTFSSRELRSESSSRRSGYGVFMGFPEILPLCENDGRYKHALHVHGTKMTSRDQRFQLSRHAAYISTQPTKTVKYRQCLTVITKQKNKNKHTHTQ